MSSTSPSPGRAGQINFQRLVNLQNLDSLKKPKDPATESPIVYVSRHLSPPLQEASVPAGLDRMAPLPSEIDVRSPQQSPDPLIKLSLQSPTRSCETTPLSPEREIDSVRLLGGDSSEQRYRSFVGESSQNSSRLFNSSGAAQQSVLSHGGFAVFSESPVMSPITSAQDLIYRQALSPVYEQAHEDLVGLNRAQPLSDAQQKTCFKILLKL